MTCLLLIDFSVLTIIEENSLLLGVTVCNSSHAKTPTKILNPFNTLAKNILEHII